MAGVRPVPVQMWRGLSPVPLKRPAHIAQLPRVIAAGPDTHREMPRQRLMRLHQNRPRGDQAGMTIGLSGNGCSNGPKWEPAKA